MQRTTDRLTEKIHSLTPAHLAEVERFVESLQAWERSRSLSSSAAALSEPSFATLWNNPEDDVYDAI
ncbi:MAG: hypothetical protein ABI286_12165 [Edaphobacter sp.]